MRQHVTGTLALLLLAGCGTMNVSAPAAHTLALHRTGSSVPAREGVVSMAAEGVRVLPTTQASVPPRKPSASAAPDASATSQAAAASATASRTATIAPPTTLGPATPDADTIRLIPILGDDGVVSALMTDPQSGTVTWRFSASDGGTTLRIASIALSLQSVACYPTPALPTLPPDASATPLASDTAMACVADSASGTSLAGVVDRSWAERTLSFTPAALKCASSLAPGSTGSVSLSLQDPGLLDFMRANYDTADVQMSLTLLDAQGKALAGSDGQPFVIRQTIQVQ